MSIFDQKSLILKAVAEWMEKDPVSDNFNPLEPPKDLTMAEKAILAICMNEDDVVIRLMDLGLDPNYQTRNGFTLWQLALIHGREELARKLYDKQAEVLNPSPKKSKPKTKK